MLIASLIYAIRLLHVNINAVVHAFTVAAGLLLGPQAGPEDSMKHHAYSALNRQSAQDPSPPSIDTSTIEAFVKALHGRR